MMGLQETQGELRFVSEPSSLNLTVSCFLGNLPASPAQPHPQFAFALPCCVPQPSSTSLLWQAHRLQTSHIPLPVCPLGPSAQLCVLGHLPALCQVLCFKARLPRTVALCYGLFWGLRLAGRMLISAVGEPVLSLKWPGPRAQSHLHS